MSKLQLLVQHSLSSKQSASSDLQLPPVVLVVEPVLDPVVPLLDPVVPLFDPDVPLLEPEVPLVVLPLPVVPLLPLVEVAPQSLRLLGRHMCEPPDMATQVANGVHACPGCGSACSSEQ